MAWTHIVSGKAASSGGVSVTGPTLNTTGATVGFAWLACTSSVSAPTITDNYGNTWTAVFNQTHSSGARGVLYTAENITTGSAHVVSSPAVGNSPSIYLAFFSGHRIAGMTDQSNYSTGTSASPQPGSVTPGEGNCLVLTMTSTFAGTPAPTVNGSYTYDSYYCNQGGNHLGGGLGRIIQTSATATNPTWTLGNSAGHVTAILSFLPQLAGNSISLNELGSGKIYQREPNRTSKAISFSGSYSGSPASLEIKVYQNGTSTVVQDWTEAYSFSPSAGSWTAKLRVPQGGWYSFAARIKDSAGSVLATSNTTTGKVGVGICIGCIGQSNMARMFDTYGSPSANSTTRMFGPNDTSNWLTVTGDGACMLSDKIQSGTSLPIGLLNFAVSGSGLVSDQGNGDWQTIGVGECVTAFLTGLTAAGGDCEFVLFFGCEADTLDSATTINVIKSGYATLYKRIREAVGRTQQQLGFGVSILGPIDYSTATDARVSDIREAQIQFADETPGAFIATNCLDITLGGDPPHYTGPSYIRNGRRSAQAILHQLGIEPYGARGPQIESARLEDQSTAYVTIKPDFGTQLKESDGTTDGAILTDFDVSVDNFTTELTVSSTAFVNQDVRLSIAETITGGPASLRYQYGKHPAITNIVYDNTTPQSDTIGLPLLPCLRLPIQTEVANAATAASGSAVSPFNVDKDHTWRFDSPSQTTAPNIIVEIIGFAAQVRMDFTEPMPASVSIQSITTTSVADVGGATEPTISSSAISADKKKVDLTLATASATAGTYTFSVKIVTTDSQTFVRKGRLTLQ